MSNVLLYCWILWLGLFNGSSLNLAAYGQDNNERLQLEVAKLKAEIRLLEQQNKRNEDLISRLLDQGLALIGIAGGAGAVAFFAWQRERRIPPTGEQEKVLENLVKD
jgi:hypothetical protein